MNLPLNSLLPKRDIGTACANLVVFLYLLPLLIAGENSFVGIGDNLDAHIIWYKILASNGMVFAGSLTPVPEIMDAPRLSLGSEFFLLFWIHYFFGTFPAIVINIFLIHFVALWGMLLFLGELKLSRVAVLSGSLFFALLPFSQFWGLSIAGQPLVLYLFLRIRDEGVKLRYLLILIIYVLYSNFYSVSGFMFVAIALFYATDFIMNRSIDWSIVATILGVVLLSLAMEYRLIHSLFFDPAYVSSRVERSLDLTPADPFHLPKLILLGHYTARYYLVLLLPLLLYAAWHCHRNKELKVDWRMKFLLILFFAIIALNEMAHVNTIYALYGDAFWNTFQFQRAYTILPFWSAIMMACSASYISKYEKAWGSHLKVYMFVLLSAVWCTNPVLLPFLPKNSGIVREDILSFRDFFAKKLFQEISDYIIVDKKSYKVASLGLFPSISQYNGFHTIDGYLTNYPLAYKREFRKIIERELSNNESIRIYFDDWGSRCYLLDDELGINFLFTKDRSRAINMLNINCDQFKKMGGRFIISAVSIKGFSCGESVKFHRTFEDDSWKVYLYEIQ